MPATASGRTYGAAGPVEPVPRSCTVSRCSRHQSRALSGAGSRAPPVRVPLAVEPACSDQRQHDQAGEHPGDRAHDHAGQQAVVLGEVLGVLGDRSGLGGGRPGPPGGVDVAGLENQRGGDVADEVESVPVGHPPRREQVPHVARGTGGGLSAPQPAGDDPPGASVRRAEGDQLVEGLAGCADQQEPERAHQRPEEQPDHHERQRPQGAVGQQGVERRGTFAAAVVRGAGRAVATPRCAASTWNTHRVRDHHRAVAGTRGPPAEVDVVARRAGAARRSRAARERAGGPASRRC